MKDPFSWCLILHQLERETVANTITITTNKRTAQKLLHNQRIRVWTSHKYITHMYGICIHWISLKTCYCSRNFPITHPCLLSDTPELNINYFPFLFVGKMLFCILFVYRRTVVFGRENVLIYESNGSCVIAREMEMWKRVRKRMCEENCFRENSMVK